jgi:hypothetical protein
MTGVDLPFPIVKPDTQAAVMKSIQELIQRGMEQRAVTAEYGTRLLELLAELPNTDTVAGIEHFHHQRAMSLQKQPAVIPANAIEVTLPLFSRVMDADNTMRRRKFVNAYQYECRLGIAGWLMWGTPFSFGPGPSGKIGRAATPSRYLIDPTYAERIKLDLT